ncbi:ribonuclease PH [candidate division WOR-3 bacterium]|nr:ribonuclease PH [candidate division WOR-3 bacterium]
MERRDKRKEDELRPVKIEKDYLKDSEGSCLIKVGKTKIICSATVEERVPYFLRNEKTGWITATYNMLPRSSHERIPREKTSGRTYEIQRLIGRTLRSISNLEGFSGFTITVDCDVLQADGGTRTASITGGYIALYDAVQWMLQNGLIEYSPLREFVAAVSVGIVNGVPILDLTYKEDSIAEVDMSIAMTESLGLVEIQGTGEKRPFTKDEFEIMLELATKGIKQLIEIQKQVLFLQIA